MDRQTLNVEITPEQMQWLRRSRAAAAVMLVGFFALVVFSAPEGDSRVARPAVPAAR